MPETQIRVPRDVSSRLLTEVCRLGTREPVVFGFANHAEVAGKRLILITEVVSVPERAYLPSAGHGARWAGAYTIELLNRAVERRQGLFIFHAHGNEGPAHMSLDDKISAGKLLPKFQVVAPRRPHGSIVIGPDSVAGMVVFPESGSPTESFSLRLMGDQLTTWPLPKCTREERILIARQPIAANALVDEILRRTTVAVVGLSGGGSQVVRQLASVGIGEIIGIDNQRVDRSNKFATDAFGWLDVSLNRKKAAAMRTKVWWINRRAKFTPVFSRVPEKPALEALKRADALIGCVNNLHARADLMEVAWRYCIPYIDVGMAVKTRPDDGPSPDPLGAIPGNVFTAIPGGPCMWCSGFLTQEKLDAETKGRGRAYLQSANDADERDAHVVSFNATLAGQAVSELLQLVLGYTPAGHRAPYRRYDGLRGELREWEVSKDLTCDLCSTTLCAGNPFWS